MKSLQSFLPIAASLASVVLLASVVVIALRPSTSADPSRPSTPPFLDDDVASTSSSEPTGVPPTIPDADAAQNTEPPVDDVVDSSATPNADELASTAPSNGDPAAATPQQPQPWSTSLRTDVPPLPLSEYLFQRFDTTKSLPTIGDLNSWLESLPDHPHAIHEVNTSYGKTAGFRGVMRLRSPWPRDATMRISVSNVEQFSLHLYNGEEGLTFSYYPRLHDACAAYRTTREPNRPLPKTSQLLATSGDRCRRTELRLGGPLLIRQFNDELVVSRGDIVLVRAPCTFEITEAFVAGGAAVLGIEMLRLEGSLPVEEPRRLVASIDRPATLDWEEHIAEGATFERLPDGSVRLAADNAAQRGYVMAPVPRVGFHEFIFEVVDATIGGGVFVGTTDEKPRSVIRFLQNTSNKQLCLSTHGNDDSRQVGLGTTRDRIVSNAGSHQWIKVVYGCGSLRWWMSADGINWAEPSAPMNGLDCRVTHIGLHHVGRFAGCQITLRNLQLRELTAVTSLADPKLLPHGVVAPTKRRFDEWEELVMQAREDADDLPKGTSDEAWWRACAVRTLMAGCGRDLGVELLSRLLDDAVDRNDLSLEQKLAAMNEAALLLDLRDNRAWVSAHLDRVMKIGRQAIATGERGSFAVVHKTLMKIPINTRHNTFAVADPEFLKFVLLDRIYSRDFANARAMSTRLRFFGQHQKLPLLPWFEAITARALNLPELNGSATRKSAEWQPLWVEQLDKRAYNTMAELYSLAESDTFEDAATMIVNVDADAMQGLAPTRDPMLMAAPEVAIRALITTYPEVASAITNDHADLAELRTREAIRNRDARALELATVQFAGTSAAATAYTWLGDQALASGWFDVARRRYESALQTALPTARAKLQTCLRLAGAMQGEEIGDPTDTSVELDGTAVSAADFEQLVQQAIENSARSEQLVLPAQITANLPEPTEFEADVQSRFDGDIGQSPNAQVTRSTTQLGVDWAGRQLSVVLHDSRTYVANRFQISAYQTSDGKRLWRSEKPPGSIRKSREWSLIPMQPIIVGDRIFARMLYGEGPMLSCWNREDGKRVWTTPLPRGRSFITDPKWVQGQLVGLTGIRDPQGSWMIDLVHVNPLTGLLDQEHRLAQLRTPWETRHCGEVSVVDGDLIVTFSGVVLRCNVQGEMKWLRRQVVVPATSDESWVQQTFQPPLLVDDRLYVVQPGVRAIECIDPELGTLHWQRVVPDIRRVIAVRQGRIIVQVGSRLASLDAVSGDTQWTTAEHDFMVATSADDQHVVVATKFWSPKKKNHFKPRLIWFDLNTGRRHGATTLDLFEAPDGWCGPMFQDDDSFWLFSGRGKHEANRDFVRLAPRM